MNGWAAVGPAAEVAAATALRKVRMVSRLMYMSARALSMVMVMSCMTPFGPGGAFEIFRRVSLVM